MLALFLLIIFGLGMSYFATQNTGIVHVVFGNYLIQGIPLYIIVVGALLLGIFISWLISIVDTFSSKITIHGKVSEIKEAHEIINRLQQENHNLEIEIARLKTVTESNETIKYDSDSDSEAESTPSFLNRLTHNIGITSK
jgi:hypothetical protein